MDERRLQRSSSAQVKKLPLDPPDDDTDEGRPVPFLPRKEGESNEDLEARSRIHSLTNRATEAERRVALYTNAIEYLKEHSDELTYWHEGMATKGIGSAVAGAGVGCGLAAHFCLTAGVAVTTAAAAGPAAPVVIVVTLAGLGLGLLWAKLTEKDVLARILERLNHLRNEWSRFAGTLHRRIGTLQTDRLIAGAARINALSARVGELQAGRREERAAMDALSASNAQLLREMRETQAAVAALRQERASDASSAPKLGQGRKLNE